MEQPDTPTVGPSEPEEKRQLVNAAINKATDPNTLKQVNLQAAYEYLYSRDFSLDESGFIIHQESGEHAVPYIFSKEQFDQIDSPAEDPFDAYFVPMDSTEGRIAENTKERLHLSDLHAILYDSEGDPHPVTDDVFKIEQFHKNVGMMFETVMGWSSALQTAHVKGYENKVEVHFNTFPSEATGGESWEINCFAPECGFSGHPNDWDGEQNNPECPKCGNKWDENITVCMNCQEWHMGVEWNGDSIYAEPVCPNCGAGVEHHKIQTRYDDL